MKLKLTDEEFITLVDLVYAGNWVINSCRLSNEAIEPYGGMNKRILTILAKKRKRKPADAEHLGDEVRESLLKYLNFYAYQIMLGELAARLAEDEHGEKLTLARTDREDEYRAEFAESGLKNVVVNLQPQKMGG